jgi:hypothetical protein
MKVQVKLVETIGWRTEEDQHNLALAYPTNITTLSEFSQERTGDGQDKDLMQYGAPHKRCHLIPRRPRKERANGTVPFLEAVCFTQWY